MRHKISDNIFKVVRDLLRQGKTVPIIKIKYDPRLRVGGVISLRGWKFSSIKVKIVDIKEHVIDHDKVPEDLKIVYDEHRLKEVFNNQHIKKVYILYVKNAN